ncbi:MAG TPA: NAD-dependent malic enzyme [Gammaproteobacteria bacterium]|nr:NAD-dependent malic enzyme [Gammaproteobacteria bacterium]
MDPAPDISARYETAPATADSNDADRSEPTIKIAERGNEVLRDPMLNKGTAFTAEERYQLGLEGLLPSRSSTQSLQAHRIYEQIQAQPDELHKYLLLSALQNRNTRLFYRVLRDHLEDLMPIVYTPTVGTATQRFSRVFQGGGGVWVTPDMKGRMKELLRDAIGARDIRLLVVTDNESILGLGDQGAGGMAISVGKLALYTAAAGIDPASALPVSLDFGTDNEELLADEGYLGWPARRLRGKEYLALVDEFVAAVKALMPHALVQWEDFRKDNALAILDRFVDRVPSFNDDIQGTGAVVVAGINSALKIKNERLADQRIVILGAGAAGLGVARQIKAQLADEGVPAERRAGVVAVLDRNGLVVADGPLRDAYKAELAWPVELAREHDLDGGRGRTLLDVVGRYGPTILIGLSGVANAFDERVVREMASFVERPVILPSSNPSSISEAQPADLYRWTEGRCLVATGSPFPDVVFGGRRYRVGQGNNVFIFPGLGLGALAARARKVTVRMTNAASAMLASRVTKDELAEGLLFPNVSRLGAVTFDVALAVAREAVREGVSSMAEDALEREIRATMWTPDYPTFAPA